MKRTARRRRQHHGTMSVTYMKMALPRRYLGQILTEARVSQRIEKIGGPDEIRTHDLCLRRAEHLLNDSLPP